MTQYTRLHASNLLLAALGNPNSGGDAALWLAGWSSNEIQCGVGCSHPQNNLWACGIAMPGGSCWNCPQYHVQNYPSLAEGVAAMVINLHNGLYDTLVGALAANNVQALTNGSVAKDLQTWCGSVCYSEGTAQFISEGQAHAQDLFDDAGANSGGGSVPVLPQTGCKACLTSLNCPSGYVCQPDPKAKPGQRTGCCVPSSTTTQYQNCAPWDVGCLLGNVGVWATTENFWPRLLKGALGLIALGFGLAIIFAVLTDKVESSPVGQAATKAAATVGVA